MDPRPRSTAATLWALARPRLLPYVLLLVLGGYGWAHWDRALTGRAGLELLLVLAAWSLLHAGTLWLNAALDRDEGEVLYGEAVVAPEWVAVPGYLALVGTVVLAHLADPLAGLAADLCALLAVLYSHPATTWKGHPVLGPLVNLAGYGLLSPLAGWAVVDVGPDVRTVVVWLLGAAGILGAYFLAQAFQGPEDAARGYRTLVVTHGPRVAILAGLGCLLVPFAGGTALAVAGWIPRVCLVVLPLGVWLGHGLWRWSTQPGEGGETRARAATRRLMVSSLVTLGVTLTWYGYECLAGVPVAGLGTAAGLPPDRPAWPPAAMRAWEAAQARGQDWTPPLPPEDL